MTKTLRRSKLIIPVCVFLFLLFTVAFIHAGEPPKDPILRIETGMHTALVSRTAVDTDNRYLVTGSHDKTVRVWELSTGRLIKTLRVPLGEGNEGKIFSVAITPDGNTIACGGWTGHEWDNASSIYLFDRESGRLIRRITSLPQVIFHLAYSKDGRFLVVALGGNNGIRLYRTSDYSQIGEDKEYGSDSYGADFSGAKANGATPFLRPHHMTVI